MLNLKASGCLGLGLILLAGCATPYKSDGLLGGFSETQLSPNVWRVNFHGNGYTRSERASDMALLRSADITLENGFTHFALADSGESSKTSAYTTPIVANTSINTTHAGNQVYGSARTTYSGGQTYFVSSPSANNTVVMFKGQPSDVPMAFDAAFLCQSLGRKYDATCETMKQKK